jgi:hypothetical protein
MFRTTAAIDLFAILFLKMTHLFVISLLLIDPADKKVPVPDNFSEVLMTVTWEDVESDIDLWCYREGTEAFCGFSCRETDIFRHHGDCVSKMYVTQKGWSVAMETLTIESRVNDIFHVLLHAYSIRSASPEVEVTIKIEQIRPYKVICMKKVKVSKKEPSKIVKFEMTKEKGIISADEDPAMIYDFLSDKRSF